MGQKINPTGLRLGVNRTADSRWYAETADFGRLLHEDIKIRKYIKEKLKQAGVSKVIIERPHKKCRITVHTARPGMVIGKKGADIETLRKAISKLCKDEVFLNLVEIRKPETDSNLVAEDVARQLERRVSFRRAMKRAMQTSMRMGAQGIRLGVEGENLLLPELLDEVRQLVLRIDQPVVAPGTGLQVDLRRRGFGVEMAEE